MKKVFKNIIKLWIVFVVASSSVGVFATTDWDRTQIIKQLQKEKTSASVEVNEVLEKNEQEVQEETTEEKQEVVEQTNNNNNNSQPVVQETTQPVVSAPANSISISGALYKSLMKDNDGSHFYLNHNEQGVYDGLGVPFVDYRTNFWGRKTIIYAHSSPNGNGPFQALQNYHNNPGYFQSHRYITVNYNGATYTYEIFSVYVALANSVYDNSLEYFYAMNYSDYEWQQTLEQYKRNSEYETGVSVNSSDKILILQTCSMDPAHSGYMHANVLVMGKLI